MPRKPLYQDAKGLPTVRESVTVFLDILGYRDAVASTSSVDNANAELRKLRKALDRAHEHLLGKSTLMDEMEFWKTRAFTDNIVIGYPTVDPSALAEPELGSVFFHLSLFQLEMIRAGYFVRGGIAVGELYVDEEMVFGKALLEAYDAERNHARNPRIVLAPSAEQLVEKHLNWYYPVAAAPHNHVLLRDADGLLFLNYLDETIMIAVDEAGPFMAELVEHKERVEEMLGRHQGEPRIWTKYEWVGRYHNFFCDLHREYFDESVKVSEDALRTGPRLLVQP